MAVREHNGGQSFLGKVLKEYRKEHELSQEELASDLGIEPRTLRSWENENPTNNIRELRRISDLLGISPERLGLAASLYVPRTPEQVEEVVDHVWSLMHDLRIIEARNVLNKLLQDISYQARTGDPAMQLALAHVYHVAGYVASMSARTLEVPQAIRYYHQMEDVSRELNDQTLLNTALSYQGDMYRRIGNIKESIDYLEAARDLTPLADPAARGNAIQFLGRAYLPAGNIPEFEYVMAQAEELGHQIDAQTNSIHGHFNLGTVYEEYAKSYALLGQTQKALDYADLTASTLPKTKNNEVLLMIVRSEALIYSGEIDLGKSLAIEAARVSRMQGHQRRLERLYKIKRHMHEQSLRLAKTEMELGEALEGPIEQYTVAPRFAGQSLFFPGNGAHIAPIDQE